MHLSTLTVSDFKRLFRDQPAGQTGHPRRSVYISAEVSQSSWDSRSQPKSGHCDNKGQI